ncbi:MAG: Hsp20/alpha crystallin family protein [Massilia sp.]
MASNLTRFDPFGDFTRMSPLRAIDEMFRDMTPRGMGRDMQSQPMIGVDVTENDQAYTVRAEIPGVKKEDIKVDVAGNRVSISAETRRESEQKEGERVLRSELYYGQQSRTFMLDQDIDDTKAEAKYVDGMLELTLPKKAGAGSKKLEVH